MRLFYSYIIFFILTIPIGYWLLAGKKDLFNVTKIPNIIAYLLMGYLILAMLLYVLVPTYREHGEPALAIISMMIADGYAAYTTFDDQNVYSVLYGPTTYLIQSYFLELFSNPILGSKIYGVLCYFSGFCVLGISLLRKYGFKKILQGMSYFSIVTLLFAQVAFRNQADSIIMFGNALAVSTVLLPSTWISKILLAFGSALSISGKFHAIGYIIPLAWFFYRQHGFKNLVYVGVLCFLLVFSPFFLESYSLSNFLTIMHAYSKLELHIEIFFHNLSTAYIIYLPLLLLSLLRFKAMKVNASLSSSELLWTLFLTNSMLILVSLTAAIDGAGAYHLVQFAPVFAVLYTLYYSEYEQEIKGAINSLGRQSRAIFSVSMIAWSMAVFVFIISVQKKYIFFIRDNFTDEIQMEVMQIGNEIKKNSWRVFFGFAGAEAYQNTYYRPLLWRLIKDNSFDPFAVMGRQAVGVDIPNVFEQRIAEQYYDVIIIPRPGEPFSMYNWHVPDQLVFGTKIPQLFEQNYSPLKEYKHFVLWQARRKDLISGYY